MSYINPFLTGDGSIDNGGYNPADPATARRLSAIDREDAYNARQAEKIARIDPLDVEEKALRQKQSNLNDFKSAATIKREEFLAGEGSDLFELDASTGKHMQIVDPATGKKSYVPKAGQIQQLQTDSQKTVGFWDGAFSDKVAGEQTEEARAAAAQIPNLEKQRKLKMEKFQRIQGDIDRSQSEHDEAEKGLGDIAARRLGIMPPGSQPAEQVGQDVQVAQPSAETGPVNVPDVTKSPADLVRMRKQLKDAEAAGDTATFERIRGEISQGFTTLDPERQARVEKTDPTFWGEVGKNALNLAKDIPLAVGSGVIGLGEAAVGLANIPTLGYAGKALQDVTGYDPKASKEFLGSLQSEELQAAKQEVSDTKGFIPTVKALVERPSAIMDSVAESAPSMLGGAAIGRTALALAPAAMARVAGLLSKTGINVTASMVAAGIGEGATTAGQQIEQTRQETGDLTVGQIGLGLASGVATSVIGVAGNKVANAMGLGDLDQMLVKGQLTVAKHGLLKRVFGGAFSEGVLEELGQSAQEQVAQNLATGKPWNKGLLESAAAGMVTGGVMGGGGNVLTGSKSAPPPPPAPAPAPAAPVTGATTTPVAPVAPNVDVTANPANGAPAEAFQFTNAEGRTIHVAASGLIEAQGKLPTDFVPDMSKTRMVATPTAPVLPTALAPQANTLAGDPETNFGNIPAPVAPATTLPEKQATTSDRPAADGGAVATPATTQGGVASLTEQPTANQEAGGGIETPAPISEVHPNALTNAKHFLGQNKTQRDHVRAEAEGFAKSPNKNVRAMGQETLASIKEADHLESLTDEQFWSVVDEVNMREFSGKKLTLRDVTAQGFADKKDLSRFADSRERAAKATAPISDVPAPKASVDKPLSEPSPEAAPVNSSTGTSQEEINRTGAKVHQARNDLKMLKELGATKEQINAAEMKVLDAELAHESTYVPRITAPSAQAPAATRLKSADGEESNVNGVFQHTDKTESFNFKNKHANADVHTLKLENGKFIQASSYDHKHGTSQGNFGPLSASGIQYDTKDEAVAAGLKEIIKDNAAIVNSKEAGVIPKQREAAKKLVLSAQAALDEIKAKKDSGKRLGFGSRADGTLDIIDHISELGGIPRPHDDAAGRGEWNGHKEISDHSQLRLLIGKSKGRIDNFFDELNAMGGHAVTNLNDLHDKMVAALQARGKEKLITRQEENKGKFYDAALENKGRSVAQKAGDPVAIDSLGERDTFNVKGEPLTVKEVTEDGTVIAKDGARFGTVELPAGQMLYPDKGTFQKAEKSEEDKRADTLEDPFKDTPVEDSEITFNDKPDLEKIREEVAKTGDFPKSEKVKTLYQYYRVAIGENLNAPSGIETLERVIKIAESGNGDKKKTAEALVAEFLKKPVKNEPIAPKSNTQTSTKTIEELELAVVRTQDKFRQLGAWKDLKDGLSRKRWQAAKLAFTNAQSELEAVKPWRSQDKPQSDQPKIVQRGSATPENVARFVLNQSGLSPSDRAGKFIQDFVRRLHRASKTSFENMEVQSLTQAEWDANTELGQYAPDSAAAFDQKASILYLNSDKTQGEAIVNAFVHEMGHFAEKFAIKAHFTAQEFAKLTDEQVVAAAKEYNPKETRSAKELRADSRVRSEWFAMQFARVVSGKTEQMSKGLKAQLEAFLKEVREMLNKWIGDGKLTTAELDARILDALGYAFLGDRNTFVGENAEGQSIYSDENGVRHIETIPGLLKSEPVGMAPYRAENGATGYRVEVRTQKQRAFTDYETTTEAAEREAKAKPAAAAPKPTVKAGENTDMFTGGETGGDTTFNLQGETGTDFTGAMDAQAKANADKAAAEAAQGNLFDAGQPKADKPAAPAPAPISDALAAQRAKAKAAFALLGTPAEPEKQVGFPEEQIGIFVDLAKGYIAVGIKTPDALAIELSETIGTKARKYTRALWKIMEGQDPSLPDDKHDWNSIYGQLDGNTKNEQPTTNERDRSTSSDQPTSVGQSDAGSSTITPATDSKDGAKDGINGAAPGVASEGVDGADGERGGLPLEKPDAGQSGGKRRSRGGQPKGGEGGGDVGNTQSGSTQDPAGSSDATDTPEQRGEGSKPNAGNKRAKPAERPVNDRNHRIGADDTLIVGGDKAKAKANVSALKLLRVLESENRNPTPEEKTVLAQYVGWGSLPNVFNRGIATLRDTVKSGRWMSDEQRTELANWEKSYGKLYDEVKELLTPEEYAAAAKSTLNAHYTSRDVIAPMWDIVRKLGFKGGTALETSSGIGHFIGLQPADMADSTQWKAVELDSVTGRMAAKLYPEAQVQVTGFQSAKIKDHSVDLVIGNYPFAKDGPNDSRYPKLSLHNYFFARAMDTLKPGGLMVAITSNSTMDSSSSKAAREWLAERGDLVGAIRLPNNAFKKNAGTEVTTDIIILRKRGNGSFSGAQNWINVQTIPTADGKAEVPVNEYFARNPDMMLGKMTLEGTMYRGDEPALIAIPGAIITEQLAAATDKLPAGIIGERSSDVRVDEKKTSEGDSAQGKEGSVVVKEGNAYQIENGVLTVPAWSKTAAKVATAKSYSVLRDHLKSMLEIMQSTSTTEESIDASRAKLNSLYDAHVKKHGAINERSHNFLEDDPELPLVQALEDSKTSIKETTVKSGKNKGQVRQSFVKEFVKATIFSKRTIFPRTEPITADTIADAITQSLAYRNEIDTDYIAQLRGITTEEATKQLQAEPSIYLDPKTGRFNPSDAYLSGFVREKLAEAKKAVKDDASYQKNVDALEAAQPRWLGMAEISLRLGSSWLPPSIIKSFLSDKLQVGAQVVYIEQTGHWKLNATSGYMGAVNTTTYGTTRVDGHELVEDALNLKSPVVMDPAKDKDSKPTKNQQETLIAQQKQSEIQELFKAYVKEKADAHPELEKIYNDRFNGVTLRKFSGPTWENYPNASHEIKLRDHQKNVVSRILQESTLLAHSVGTGKTFIMITAAMEMRRLGMSKKPMIVTQNATTQQFAASFKKLYPTARILVPNKNQRMGVNRKLLMSQIATGDYDAVIIPQSFLNQLPDDPARLRAFIQQEIDELEAGRIAAKQAEGERSPKVKDLEKAKDRLKAKLEKLADRATDDTVTFEQLGVDSLFVDEAHAYKKLEFSTQMDNVKGLDRGASERGLGLYMKTRWIQEKANGKNVILATGTPVSNTIAEAWNMLRFTRPDLLEKYGVEKFDDFASTFGDTITNIEQTAGGGFKQVTRFAKYTNGPELIAMFHSAADVVLKEDINLPDLPALKNGQPTTIQIKQTKLLSNYIKVLRDRLAEFEAMTGKEKRENSHIPLVVFGLAKKATLDLRLIDPSLPDEAASKLNETVRNVARIYEENNDTKGAQLVFADLFQSSDETFNLYREIRDKLVKAGIPTEQIAIIGEAKNDAQRERIFESVKSGDVRVMLGSTEKMGVGVNVQDRLIALHHMDAPARPMDIEQRNGRIIRQGNQNPVVEVFNYGVENTLDATLYQRLAIKQKFINQIMRGDIDGRSFEDAADEVSMTFEEQMAAFSGNPLAMKRVSIEGEVRKLESLKSGHARQLADTYRKLDQNRLYLIEREAYQPKIEAAAALMEADLAKDITGVVDGKTYTDRKELVDALNKKLSDFMSEHKEHVAGKVNSMGWSFPADSVTLYGHRVMMTLRIPSDMNGVASEHARSPQYVYLVKFDGGVEMGSEVTTGNGLLLSFAGQGRSMESRVAQSLGDVNRIKRDITEMTGFVGQPFQQEKQLRDARAELVKIDAALQASSKPMGIPIDRPQGELSLEDDKARAPRRSRLRRMAEKMQAQIDRLRSLDADSKLSDQDTEFSDEGAKFGDVGESRSYDNRATELEARLKKVTMALLDEENAGLTRAKASGELLGTPASTEKTSQSPSTESKEGYELPKITYAANRPHTVLQAEAKAHIADVGEAQAVADALERGNTSLQPDTKEAIRHTVFKRLNQQFIDPTTPSSEHEKIKSQMESLSEEGNSPSRETARALSARQLYGKDARVASAMQHISEIKKRQEQAIGNDGQKAVDDTAEAINGATREAGKQVEKQAKEKAEKLDVGISLWERYRADAADRLAKLSDPKKQTTKEQAPLAEFAGRVVAELKARIKAALPASEAAKNEAPSAMEVLTEAIQNKERFKEVFESVRAEMVKKHGEGSPLIDAIDAEMSNIGVTPYTRKSLDRAVKDAHEAMKIKVGELARLHVSKTNAKSSDLAKSLVDEAGLTGADAKTLAADLDTSARQLIAAARTKALDQMKAKFQNSTLKAKRIISAIAKVSTLNNLGALTRADLMPAVAKELNLPGVTVAGLKKIADLADKVETAPNELARVRAEYDLMNGMRIVKGFTGADVGLSVWFANLLSGFTTQMANAQSNMFLSTIQVGTLMATNPKNAGHALSGWVDGFRGGFLHGKEIMKTGRSLREMGEVAKTGEAGNVLETVNYARDFARLPSALAYGLQKHAAAMKYVSRAMRAADAVFFYPAREAYARVATAKILEGQYQGAELHEKIRESLGIAPDQFIKWAQQAKAEGWTGMDKSLRVHQLIEGHREATDSKRDEYDRVGAKSEQYGRESTLNQNPVGIAGAIYRNLRSLTRDLPAMQVFLPFLRVPTNLFNTSMNFTPVGLVRAKFGMLNDTGEAKQEFTQEERSRLYFQAVAGSLAMVGIAALAGLGGDDDDDEERWFDITAKGSTDWRKNQQLEATGWRPFSIKFGDKWVSYKDSPLLLPLAAVGQAVDAKRFQAAKDELAGKNPYINALFKLPQTIFETSMLSGLGTLMDIAKGDSSPDKIEGFLANTATSLVVPNLTKQVDRLASPESRNSDGVAGRLGQTIPGLRTTGSIKTEILGDSVTRSPLDRFGSDETNDPLREVLRSKNVFISVPAKSTKLPGGAVMTPEQYAEYVKLSGDGIKKRLTPSVASFKGMDAERVEKQVDAVTQQERERAKVAVYMTSKKKPFVNAFAK